MTDDYKTKKLLQSLNLTSCRKRLRMGKVTAYRTKFLSRNVSMFLKSVLNSYHAKILDNLTLNQVYKTTL